MHLFMEKVWIVSNDSCMAGSHPYDSRVSGSTKMTGCITGYF